ncbi:MAG: hypothetical protein GY703_10985 [Gammaproteobacteria bacterium]|nr:hypothetical protein [Gammaproteobacteria bacterium]
MRKAQHASDQELAQLGPRVAQLERENAQLVKGKLPGLIPLLIDEVLPVQKKYVRDIVFTQAGKGDNKRLEYRVILDNQSSDAVQPKVEVLMFDQNGVQIGYSRLTSEKNPTKPPRVLDVGETRSHAARLTFTWSDNPAYFLVSIDGNFEWF